MLGETYEILEKQAAPPEQFNAAIREALTEHPYAAIVHAFACRSAHLLSDPRFDDLIRRAAIRTNSRSRLHNYVFSSRQTPGEALAEKETPAEKTIAEKPPVAKPAEDDLDRLFLAEALSAGVALELLKDVAPTPETTSSTEVVSESAATGTTEMVPTTEQGDGEKEHVAEQEETILYPEKKRLTEWITLLQEGGDIPAGEPTHESKAGPVSQPPPPKKSRLEMIDHFIQNEDHLVPKRAEFFSPGRAAKESLVDRDDIVTETLAKIYTAQGNYSKALATYEKLSLLHPEKSAYFAALIQQIKTEKLNKS